MSASRFADPEFLDPELEPPGEGLMPMHFEDRRWTANLNMHNEPWDSESTLQVGPQAHQQLEHATPGEL